MRRKSIEHIVFDIGRVLLHYDPQIPFNRIIPDEEERQWFFEHVCTIDWNVEQDRGRSWEEAEAAAIAAYPEHETLIRAFRLNWHEMVPHAYEDTVDIMLGLIDDGHDVTMLTNFASDTFREAMQRFDFLSEPRGVTVSADVGAIKPQPEIFKIHATAYALEPEATLFIDDSPMNVEGARAMGWTALQFTDAATLAKDLQKMRLIG
ncbi:MAG: HAD family phosphatase [Pseudomonadota bacterium]